MFDGRLAREKFTIKKFNLFSPDFLAFEIEKSNRPDLFLYVSKSNFSSSKVEPKKNLKTYSYTYVLLHCTDSLKGNFLYG